MAKKSLKKMSDSELEALDNDYAQQRLKLRDEQKEVQVERESRLLKAQAEARIASLTPNERAALAQVIQAGGIESAEDVSEPT